MGKKIAQQYLDKIEKQLREFGEQIDNINVKIKTDANFKYKETRESILAQMDEAFKKLNSNIESRFSEFEANINKLKGKTKEDAQKEFDEIFKKINPRVEEFKEVLNDLKQQSGGAFDDIKTGAIKAWKEMKTAFKNAASKFK